MHRHIRSPKTPLVAGLLAVVTLVAACGSTTSRTRTGPSSASMPGMNMGHGGSMSGMDMSENIPGDGLLMAASGLSLKSATTSVPAGQSSAYRLQIPR